jgi:hypothetical protein
MALIGTISPGNNLNFKNKIINGNFDIWQRGTSFTNAGYSADRWSTSADTNSGWTVSRQAFTVGQTEVPGEPTYFMRFAISASNLAGPVFQQKIEDVRTFAGKTVTASFYTKVSSGSTFTPSYFRMTQNFGSGGSADSFVTPIQTITAITGSWTKYTYTFNVPSITGKTIGTGNYVAFMFRIPDSTTTTVDLAQVQVEEGSVATGFEFRPIGVELQLCQRYFYKTYNTDVAVGITATIGAVYCETLADGTLSRLKAFNPRLPVSMRATPTVTLYSQTGTADRINAYSNSGSTLTVSSVSGSGTNSLLNYLQTSTNAVAAQTYEFHATASAEL